MKVTLTEKRLVIEAEVDDPFWATMHDAAAKVQNDGACLVEVANRQYPHLLIKERDSTVAERMETALVQSLKRFIDQ